MNAAAMILFLQLASVGAPIREGTVGNGGDAVVCRERDGTIRSVELLDFYEGRTRMNLSVDLGDGSLGEIAKAKLAFERLPQYFHNHLGGQRKRFYLQQIEAFLSQTNLIPDANLVDVSDSLHVVTPRNCVIEQVAIQREPRFPEEGRFIINKDLWDKMDANNRAGLILHEIIYREALNYGQENSINVRYYTAMLASTRVASMNVADYVSLLQRIGFPHQECSERVGSYVTENFFHPVYTFVTSDADNCFVFGSVIYDSEMIPTRGTYPTPRSGLLTYHLRHGSTWPVHQNAVVVGDVRFLRFRDQAGRVWAKIAQATLAVETELASEPCPPGGFPESMFWDPPKRRYAVGQVLRSEGDGCSIEIVARP